VTDLGYQFVDLLEEAFHLIPGTLRSFFDRPEYQMHQGKVWVIFGCKWLLGSKVEYENVTSWSGIPMMFQRIEVSALTTTPVS
jgi:hypothetical protein